MRVFHGLPDQFDCETAVILGNFDGVHLGHRFLIQTCKEKAKLRGLEVVLVTSEPHPLRVLQPDKSLKLLTSSNQKETILEQLELDCLVYLPFTAELAGMSARVFVEQVLVKLRPRLVSVGFNYHFGRGGLGDSKLLQTLGKRFGFDVLVAPPYLVGGTVVSSTEIRRDLEQGDVGHASLFLGRFPAVSGQVVKGDGRGRTFGIPTANVEINEEVLLPATGVYAGYVRLDRQCYKAVANIGYKPTFGSDLPKTLEAFVLDFDDQIYGRSLEVIFVERLRGEKKFVSIESLLEQIEDDIRKARGLL